VEFTGMCYTTIYTLEKAGKFPKRRQLSPGRVAWLRSEVAAWLQSCAVVGVAA
jgi:predicted DNA-binding transcriptional regulator AlpA